MHPPVTVAFARHLCSMGEKVEFRAYPSVGHDAGAESASDVAAWIADRFASKPPPSTC